MPIYTEEGEALQSSLRITINPEQQPRFEARQEAAGCTRPRCILISFALDCGVIYFYLFIYIYLSPHLTSLNHRAHVNNIKSGNKGLPATGCRAKNTSERHQHRKKEDLVLTNYFSWSLIRYKRSYNVEQWTFCSFFSRILN